MADEPWFDPEEDAANFDRRQAEESARQAAEAEELKESIRRLRKATREARKASAGGGRAATPETPGEDVRPPDPSGPTRQEQDAARKLADAAEKLLRAAGLFDRSASRGGGAAAPQDGSDPIGQLVDQQITKLTDDLLRQLGNKLGSAVEGRLGGGVGRAVGQVVGEGGGLLARLGLGGGRAAAPVAGAGGAAGGGAGAARAAAGAAGGGAAGGGGAAAAGAAGGGGAAAAGGPVAIAAMVALAVDQAVKGMIKDREGKLLTAIEGLTGAYESAVSGDVEGLAKGGSEAVAGKLEDYGIAGHLMAERVRVTTALVFAFKDLYDATIDAAKAQEQHNFRLSEASAAMAAVEAEVDVRETFRNREMGDRTAATSNDLSDSLQDLADQTREARILLNNLINTGLAELVDLFALVIKPITALAEGVNFLAKRLGLEEQKEGDPNKPDPETFGGIMEQARRAEDEARRLGEEWYRRSNDFGHQHRDEWPR